MKTTEEILKKICEISGKTLHDPIINDQGKKVHIINKDKADAAYDALMWCLEYCDSIELR
jgi:hypothetical protein